MRASFLTAFLSIPLLAALAATGHAAQPVPSADMPASNCTLLPLPQQLQTAEVRREMPQYAETNYRNELLRFTTGFYARLAQDLLRGDGEYLTSLHRLMGSHGDTCTAKYRELLLSHGNARDFALALWQWRQGADTSPTTTEQTSVHAAVDSGAVLLVE